MDDAWAQPVSFSPLNGVASHRFEFRSRSMGHSSHSRTKGLDAQAVDRVAPTLAPTRVMPLPQGRGPRGSTHLARQGPGIRPHGPREITSSLAPSAPESSHPESAVLFARSLRRSGRARCPLPGPSRSYSGCFLHLIESVSTPLDGASPLAPLESVRASPLSAALTNPMGASFPTHEAWGLVMRLRSTLCFRKGMVRRSTSS